MTKKTKETKKRKGTSFGYEDRQKESILQKTVDIFEAIKKTQINLDLKTYALQNQADVYDGYDDKKHFITVGKRKDENVKTSLERGLAYVAFDTSKKQYVNDPLYKENLKQFAQIKHQSQVSDLIDSVYASLESRRVHSCMGHVFKGFDERYKEADKLHAKNVFTSKADFTINDPVTALQCSQLGLEELVENSDFPEANKFMKNVERTSGAGSLILTKDFVEDVLKPWYQKTFGNEPEGGQGGDGEGDGDSEGDSEGSNENDSDSDDSNESDSSGYDKPHKDAKNWKGKKPTEKQTDYLEKLGYDGKIPDTRGGTSDLISELANDEGITNPDPVKDHNVEEDDADKFDPVGNEDDKKLQDLEFNTKWQRQQTNIGEKMTGQIENFTAETLEEAQQDGDDLIENIEDALSEIGRGDSEENKSPRKITWRKKELEGELGGVEEIKNLPVIAQPQVDQQTVNKLKQIFKRIKSKPREEVSDSGTEIDVDLFIKDELEGATDFLIEDVEQQGFAVVIGIDESGSMGGNPIQIARNLCGTLYKAFENMPNVEIHVIGWQSNVSHCDIHKITSYREVGTLHAGGGTPFTKATLYLGEFVKKLPQKKKLFFQITDGGVAYDKKTKVYLENMRKENNTVVTGMLISYYDGGDQAMEDLFGKDNFLRFNNMEAVKSVMINDIAKRFLRHMKC